MEQADEKQFFQFCAKRKLQESYQAPGAAPSKDLSLAYAMIFAGGSEVYFRFAGTYGEFYIKFETKPSWPLFMKVTKINQLNERPLKARMTFSVLQGLLEERAPDVVYPGSTHKLIQVDGTFYDDYYKDYTSVPELTAFLTDLLQRNEIEDLGPHRAEITAMASKIEETLYYD